MTTEQKPVSRRRKAKPAVSLPDEAELELEVRAEAASRKLQAALDASAKTLAERESEPPR